MKRPMRGALADRRRPRDVTGIVQYLASKEESAE